MSQQHFEGLESDGYLLPRDESEQLRLTAQHYAFTQRTGWLLHPTVAEHVETVSSPAIADVACGNGIWALEVADRIPHLQVTGLDISKTAFPQQATWPQNCVFEQLDLSQPPTASYQARFDVVHVRMLLTAGPIVDPRVWIRHLRALLKPGGYLQWEDLRWPWVLTPDLSSNGKCLSVFDSPFAPILVGVASVQAKIEWFGDFETVINEVGGWEGVDKVTAPFKKHLLETETWCVTKACSSGLAVMLASGKIQDQRLIGRLRDEAATIQSDVNGGALLAMNLVVRLARRSD